MMGLPTHPGLREAALGTNLRRFWRALLPHGDVLVRHMIDCRESRGASPGKAPQRARWTERGLRQRTKIRNRQHAHDL
jgi:hypothetical protein